MFIAINYITCEEDYRPRFEEMMKTRARAVDTMPGFRHMEVLKPQNSDHEYLIISHWDAEEYFQKWRTSGQFAEGHRRGFSDISRAKAEGRKPLMQSSFKTYEVLTD